MKLRSGGYANVASTLALVVALGGTSYAAVAIPKNSVGSKQIVNGSVTSKDVKNGNLRAVDFKAGQLPAGPAGPAGPQGAVGPQGPVGPSTGYRVDSGSDVLNWTGVEQTVSTLDLPAGSYVLFGKVLGNNNSAGTASLTCRLRANGAVIDTGFDGVNVEGTAVDRAYIPLAGAVTLPAASTATVTCTSTQPAGNWLNRAITAVKVGSIG